MRAGRVVRDGGVEHDAVVVGAGPAGLAAATLLARHGADVVLFDEQPAPGGQIWRGIERASPALRSVLGADFSRGSAVASAFRASGARYRPDSAVWQITPAREIWVSRGGASTLSRARSVILATGAMERPVPLPGWTRPGVVSAGALQILLKTGGLIARDAVLVGSGPLLFLLAAQCIAAGAPPRAVIDTAPRGAWRRALRHASAVLGRAGVATLAKGVALQGALRAAGTPWHRHAKDISIEADSDGCAVCFDAGGRCHRVRGGLVALHEGVIPATHVARSIGCAFEWSASQACFHPTLDGWGASTVEGILIAGDASGIAGATAALHAGRIVALEALRRCGRIDAARRDALAAPARKALAAERGMRPLLDALFPPSPSVLRPADDVVVCRCEEVRAGAIRAAVAQGCQGPNQAKAFLRVGMGACQGRVCGPVVTALMADARGVPEATIGALRVRPPLLPVTVGELAGADSLDLEPM